MFYYSLIGLACNYMFLQDLSLLINRKKIILFIVLARLWRVILSKKFNGLGREEYLHPNELPFFSCNDMNQKHGPVAGVGSQRRFEVSTSRPAVGLPRKPQMTGRQMTNLQLGTPGFFPRGVDMRTPGMPNSRRRLTTG